MDREERTHHRHQTQATRETITLFREWVVMTIRGSDRKEMGLELADTNVKSVAEDANQLMQWRTTKECIRERSPSYVLLRVAVSHLSKSPNSTHT